ncbi:hypothetical protein [Amycolatopsis plumensis]|uniref:hypothetical protein n=1 Tax=Amycolatopsis plumensis TaxID=236508 RepID=UPI0036154123
MRAARVVLKDGAFHVLTGMLGLIHSYRPNVPDQALDTAVLALLDTAASELASTLSLAIEHVRATLPVTSLHLLDHEFTRWSGTEGWHLINANDPCGT